MNDVNYYIIYDDQSNILGYTTSKKVLKIMLKKRLSKSEVYSSGYVETINELYIKKELLEQLESYDLEIIIIDDYPLFNFEIEMIEESLSWLTINLNKTLKFLFKLTNVLNLSNDKFDKLFKMLYLLADKYEELNEAFIDSDNDTIFNNIIKIDKLV